MSSLVVGYDGTPGSNAALREAVRLAGALRCDVLLVFGAEPAGVPTEESGPHRRAIVEHATRLLARATEEVDDHGVAIRTEVATKRPVEALLEAARREDARMILVGGGDVGPLRAILGAVPHRLLHTTDRPVLVVPPSDGG